MNVSLDALISEANDLPSTPRILPRLQTLLRSSESSTKEITDLLKVDVALSARLIRYANSSFYGLTVPVNGISEAMNLLGYREVYKLISIAASRDSLNRALPFFGEEEGGLLQKSIVTAILMSGLNGRLRLGEEDAAYTAGLMHGIGKLLIDHYFKKRGLFFYGKGEFENEPVFTVEDERSMLGFDHAEAGAVLLEQWRFPELITNAVRYQFEPDKGPAGLMAWTLRICADACHFFLGGGSFSDFEPREPALLGLGTNEVEVQRALMKSEKDLESVQSLMVA